jgi:hypothetical protein
MDSLYAFKSSSDVIATTWFGHATWWWSYDRNILWQWHQKRRRIVALTDHYLLNEATCTRIFIRRCYQALIMIYTNSVSMYFALFLWGGEQIWQCNTCKSIHCTKVYFWHLLILLTDTRCDYVMNTKKSCVMTEQETLTSNAHGERSKCLLIKVLSRK